MADPGSRPLVTGSKESNICEEKEIRAGGLSGADGLSRGGGSGGGREALAGLPRMLRSGRRVCLMGHVSPDGDCMMSALALKACLGRWGLEAKIGLAGKAPYNYDQYWEAGEIEADPLEGVFDVAVALDCASLARLGPLAEVFGRAGLRIVIDHHAANERYGDFNVADPTVSSTCELLYHFFKVNSIPIDQRTAERLYIGIMADTGKFQYPATGGDTHRALGDLLDRGVKPEAVFKSIYRQKPPGLARAVGEALAAHRLFASGRVAMASVTAEMAKRSGLHIDEIDGIVDELMAIRGVCLACVLKEARPDWTKVSLRSEPGYPLAVLCERYGGGGHPHAAGFGLPMGLGEAEARLAEILQREFWGKIGTPAGGPGKGNG